MTIRCPRLRLAPTCGAFLLALLFVSHSAAADTDVTVNDARDLPDPSPNLGPDCASTAGTCTLRAAIQRANHQIGTHTIRLPAGTFKITLAGRGENDAETGDFDIKGTIIIIGQGAKSTIIDGGRLDRVFDVRSGSLLLQSLTVTNGFAHNEDGGGIRALGAGVTINRVHLRSNETDEIGGAISTNDDLSVVRSTISNNLAGQSAGGIRASFIGDLRRRDISIRESTISGNTLGGILIGVSYNVTIVHSTIAFNDVEGLSVILTGGPFAISMTINHTILANNPVNCSFADFFSNASISITSNVDSDASCDFPSAGGNLNSIDPQLSPLVDNGGQTPTHLFNNPILRDDGDTAGATCSGIDQRGFPRPVDVDGDGVARCDIGAIELQGPIGVAVLDPETTTVRKDKPLELSYLWRVPPDRVWRDLSSLDLRIVDTDDREDRKERHSKDDEILFWLRWTEATNTFQLIDPKTGRPRGPAFTPGANQVLRTKEATLDLQHSSVVGSGPTGQEVTLHLTFAFNKNSDRDEPFTIEVTAVDDGGETQPFLALGSVEVVSKKD